jgi:ABC-type spermidine/putrescine transport system permease subunit II
VLAVPYVVITVMAVLKAYDERLDEAAATLGPIAGARCGTSPCP